VYSTGTFVNSFNVQSVYCLPYNPQLSTYFSIYCNDVFNVETNLYRTTKSVVKRPTFEKCVHAKNLKIILCLIKEPQNMLTRIKIKVTSQLIQTFVYHFVKNSPLGQIPFSHYYATSKVVHTFQSCTYFSIKFYARSEVRTKYDSSWPTQQCVTLLVLYHPKYINSQFVVSSQERFQCYKDRWQSKMTVNLWNVNEISTPRPSPWTICCLGPPCDGAHST